MLVLGRVGRYSKFPIDPIGPIPICLVYLPTFGQGIWGALHQLPKRPRPLLEINAAKFPLIWSNLLPGGLGAEEAPPPLYKVRVILLMVRSKSGKTSQVREGGW